MKTLLEVKRFRTADGQRLIKPSPDQAIALVALSKFEAVEPTAESSHLSYFKSAFGDYFPWEDVWGCTEQNSDIYGYGLTDYLMYLRGKFDVRLINGYAYEFNMGQGFWQPSFDPCSMVLTEEHGYLPAEICHDGWGAPSWYPLQLWEIAIQGRTVDEWFYTDVFTTNASEHLVLNPDLQVGD